MLIIIPELESLRLALIEAGLRDHFYDSEMSPMFYSLESASRLLLKRAGNAKLDDATPAEKQFAEIVNKHLLNFE